VVRSLLAEATTLLNDVHKANGMNRTLAHQYEHLKKRVEKFKKGQKISRPSSAQKHQNEIIEELRKEVEKVWSSFPCWSAWTILLAKESHSIV
jgi:hypothetical protein